MEDRVGVNKLMRLFDFTKTHTIALWRATNDSVMGGLSQARLKPSAHQTALFMGNVSLENNGGFASVRSAAHHVDLREYAAVRLRVRGDGKHYKLRIKTKFLNDIFYEASFATKAAQYEQIEILFSTLVPKFRGNILSDVPPFNAANVESLGLMIAEKQAGNFCLEIESIEAVN